MCLHTHKSTGLFCRISCLLEGSFAKETHNFKEPTNPSHPIYVCMCLHTYIIYVAGCYSVLQCVAVCCSVLVCMCLHTHIIYVAGCYSVLQGVAVCCSVLQCVAVCLCVCVFTLTSSTSMRDLKSNSGATHTGAKYGTCMYTHIYIIEN